MVRSVTHLATPWRWMDQPEEAGLCYSPYKLFIVRFQSDHSSTERSLRDYGRAPLQTSFQGTLCRDGKRKGVGRLRNLTVGRVVDVCKVARCDPALE